MLWMCQISMALYNTSVLTTMQHCLPDLPADKFTLRETPVITGKRIKDSALDVEIKDQIRKKKTYQLLTNLSALNSLAVGLNYRGHFRVVGAVTVTLLFICYPAIFLSESKSQLSHRQLKKSMYALESSLHITHHSHTKLL